MNIFNVEQIRTQHWGSGRSVLVVAREGTLESINVSPNARTEHSGQCLRVESQP